MDCGVRSRGVADALSFDHPRRLSAGAVDSIFEPRLRSAGLRFPVAAIADCRGFGWFQRCGTYGGQTKALLSPRSAHGLYLCGDLRRAGIHWSDPGDRAVWNLWLARLAR